MRRAPPRRRARRGRSRRRRPSGHGLGRDPASPPPQYPRARTVSRTGTGRGSRRPPRTRRRRRGSRHRAPARRPATDRATAGTASVAPNPDVTIVIETAVKSARTTNAPIATVWSGIAASRSTPTPALPPMPCTSPIPKRAERRPHTVLVARAPSLRANGREVAVAPADEQPDREEDDQRRDGGLGALLDALREVALGEEDREPEDDERHGVAEPPPGAEPGGASGSRAPGRTRRASSPPRCGRDRSRGAGRAALRRARRPATEPPSESPASQSSSPNMPQPPSTIDVVVAWFARRAASVRSTATPGTAFAVIARPTTRITAAEMAGSARIDRPVEARRARTPAGRGRRRARSR